MAKLLPPAAWGKDEIVTLTGVDLLDKADLLGKPFLITDVQFKTNARNVNSVWITAMDANATVFQFTDSSSTGVREQLSQYLIDTGYGSVIDSGEVHSMRLAIMNGLRVSSYDAYDERNKVVKAKTYYLRLTPAE